MRVLLFDGQGSTPSSTVPEPSRSPLASLFLRQCHLSLRARLCHLSEQSKSVLFNGATRDILAGFQDGSKTFPISDPALVEYPLITLPNLYVTQVLRLFEELEVAEEVETEAPASVVGYSSGLLPALLVASSFPKPGVNAKDLQPQAQLKLLRNAVALFKFAFLLGVETQVSKELMMTESGLSLDDPAREKEWAAVVFGETRDALEDRVARWNAQSTVCLHLSPHVDPKANPFLSLSRRFFFAMEC
jgi:malonyl CoA-acyl carrier protein transacylase